MGKFESPPVLLLAFNRPENTQKVFEAIAQAKPSQLFFAVDGPRIGNKVDLEKSEQVKKIIEQVNWPCEVKTLFHEKNIGCKLAVSGAITWFFEHVEAGIILEDDCVPSSDFFDFCNVMLERYKDKTEIMMISGSNFYAEKNLYGIENGCFLSKYFSAWGWATWRRAWKNYDFSMQSIERKKLCQKLKQAFRYSFARIYYLQIYDELKRNEINAWDYQWFFKNLVLTGYALVPAKNLVKNIGIEGVHFVPGSKELRFLNLETQRLDITLVSAVLACDSRYHEALVRDIVSDFSKYKLLLKTVLYFFGLYKFVFKLRQWKKKLKQFFV